MVAVSAARAQQVNGYVELGAASSDAESDSQAGTSTDLESDVFFQRYNVDTVWNLWPNVTLVVGGLFERSTADSSGTLEQPDTTREKLRPYASLALGTPIYFAELGYYRLEDRLDAGDIDTREIRETYSANVGWRPVDLPRTTASVIRTESYDKNRDFQDMIETRADLQSEWGPVDWLQLYYRGGIQELEDNLEDNKVRFTSHTGRVTYSDVYLERRLLVNTEYNINYQKREILEVGTGEALDPAFPLAGLSAITDIPTDVVLSPNGALIDGNRNASAGINLGLVPPAGDDRPRNIGLDFVSNTTVDTLRVFVDRELPFQIAASFQWAVYSSSDNMEWEFEGNASANFSSLDRRFQLGFSNVTARYIKVVVAPLDPAVPEADEYPLIQVTEMQAFRSFETGGDPPSEPSRTNHRVTSGVRYRILENHQFYYDGNYTGNWPDGQESTWTLSNALSYSRQLNRWLLLASRAAREDGEDNERDFTAYPYSASLRANWLSTLQQRLVFSGRHSEAGGETLDFNSLYVQTSAELYRGISAEIGLGTSRNETDDRRTDSDTVTTTMILSPNPKVTMNLLYQYRNTEVSGDEEEPASDISATEASLSYRPFSSLYVFGSYRVEDRPDQPDRTLESYNLSWSPFPQGNLQITMRYDETYRSELDRETTIASAAVRWNITPSRWVEVSWLKGDFESEVQNREQESVQANMRFTF
jgi:hypothetical protein